MTAEEERELAPFIDAFAELLLAEERRRAAGEQGEEEEPQQEIKSPV